MNETERGAYRDKKVHVLASKCQTCVFRPGNRMHLAPGRVAEMVAMSIMRDSAIICHKTFDGDRAICRGFFDVHGTDVITLRLAVALNVVVYQEEH